VLDTAFENAALDTNTENAYVSRRSDYGIAYSELRKTWKRIDVEEYAVFPVKQNKRSWDFKFYKIDKRILKQLSAPRRGMKVTAHFLDNEGNSLFDTGLANICFRRVDHGCPVN
jgi:hypothetical protein